MVAIVWMADPAVFSRRLRMLRVKRGITQEELAACIHRTQVDIARWEDGCRVPGYRTVAGIADALGVDVLTLTENGNDALLSDLPEGYEDREEYESGFDWDVESAFYSNPAYRAEAWEALADEGTDSERF